MQKTYKIVIASIIGASLLFTGCSWVKDKLQGAVDEVNQGVTDTAKDIGSQLGGKTEETPAVEAVETPAAEAPAEDVAK
ncbi:hypothetical protein COY05_03930 [Candidatus Peregrinibacteria bacterium CG_4_10_14_0_2_um_filter_38_24]|nr:MAG: hypothetical protein COY05_03930 [Candidatus Peregrinibacteria bacterium CG_4_10_14_0_2_um_filter_38_24]PJC39265.1 MAG: hypothetical protein CO044_00650 [Candidatus Peregrinibacteria bacterium CG_4_9_14_0_2_um_filter_38_9]